MPGSTRFRPRTCHEKTALAIVCPITSNTAPCRFKVMVPAGQPVVGAVLADQVTPIDRAARRLRIAGQAPRVILPEVQGNLAALLMIAA